MKLTQRLLVLLITVAMILPGSFVQAYATVEATDSSSIVATETSGSEKEEEIKEESKEAETPSAETEVTAPEKEAADTDATSDSAEEAAPEKSETEAEAAADTDADAKADPAEKETEEDAQEKAKASSGTLTYKCDDYTVTLEYGKKADIPEDTTLKVREILADSKDKAEKKEYNDYHDETLDALKKERAEDKSVSEDIASLEFARFFDITLVSDGKEIEPKGDVSVKFEFSKDARETVGKKDDAEKNLRVVHLTENEKTGELEAAPIDKKDTEISLSKKELSEASFTTDSFSVYGIVYTVDYENEIKHNGKTETVVEAKGKTFRMEAAYDAAAGIPMERVRLSAIELEDDDPDTITFDIKIVSEADENVVYQPAEGHNVALTVVVLDKEADTDEDTASVLHVSEDGTEEMLTADLEATDEGYVYSFETESFSTFTLYRNGTSSNERFITTVKTGRFGGSQTELVGTAAISDGNETGWVDFDKVITKWNPNYSYTSSGGRYSVLKANDNGTGNRKQALCAIGFFEGYLGIVRSHLALGRFAVDIDVSGIGNGNVNGSGTSYDLLIELNDNSLPVRITENGTTTDTVFIPSLSDSSTSFTAESIAAGLGYDTDGMMVTGKINNVSADTVSRAQITVSDVPTNTGTGNNHSGKWTRLLAGETFDDFGAGTALIALNTVSYTATDVSYPAAYKWTYDNGGTQTVIGDTLYEIKILPAVAQVSNDGGTTWKKFACLITGEYDGETLEGAFNYANSLTGDVIVEMLYDTHERYTLNSGFNFNNTDITSLTINGVDINDKDTKTTLVKNQTAAPMITTTGIGTVEFNQIIFDGNDKITTNAHGGAVKTNAKNLTVNYCEFNKCQAGYQGGGICHNNLDTEGKVVIDHSTFTSCRANGPDDATGAGGGGVYTNTQSLTVTDCKFDSCTTKVRQGAGLFHQRAKTDPANSETIVKDCKFENCEAKWSGGGIESDAWKVTLDNVEFKNCKATKGGAINVWADGQDSTSNDTTFNITSCTFKDCTGTDNGGAVRSTSLSTNITESSFEGCSSNANGGALACTNNKTNTIITDCTIKDCSANGNGGAVSSAGTVLFKETQTDKTTISGCSAKKGGAIYSSKIVMTGGSVIDNTTNDTGSAAVDATTGASGITLSGNVKVKENNGSGGVYHNVYIGMDSDRHILIDRDGLGPEASVGVYVADASSAFAKHGKPNQLFAHTGDVQASTVSNLDKLFSDRLDNGPMHGKAATIGANYTLRVMWAAPICKIVDGNGEHPFETLRDALAFARGSEITTPMSASNPVKIEMLIDYVIPKSDNLTLNQATDNIIITTAATSGGTYNFRPLFTEEQGRLPEDSESIAILQRGWTQANNAEALFYINNTSASFTTGNIIIDGQSKNAGDSALLQKNGRAVYINNGSLSASGNTTFRNNKMTYNNTDGGAVYAVNELTYTVSDTGNVLFDNCSATRNGGAIYANKALTINNNNGGTLGFNACKAMGTGTNGLGGGIYGNGAMTITSTGTDKTVFTSCTANYGGGIYQNGTGNLTLTNVTFGKAGDETKGCFAEIDGGSVYSNGTNTTITDCDFYYSQAGSGDNNNNTHGGAVCHHGSGEHKVLGCVFDHCSVKTTSNERSHGNGGAVFIHEDGTSLIVDRSDTRRSTFTNCSAYRYGGAVIMEKDGDCTCSISNSDFEECWTTFRDGGAVYTDSNVTSFNDCTFKRCHSDSTSGEYDGGGAIYTNGDTERLTNVIITISDCQFEDCYVKKNGGAIQFYSTGTNATLDNVQITGAKAGLGSGVYSKGNVTIKDSEITGCSASANNGGAVNVTSGKKMYFEGSTKISGNTNTGHDTDNEHNVVLDQNNNVTINTTVAGLKSDAQIGIYVTGTPTTDPFKNHGSFKDDFGTYAAGGSTANFDRFINDRVKDSNGNPLYGELCPEQGHTSQRLIRWFGVEPVAPTGYNRNYIPFLLIFLGGAALAAVAACRRRRNQAEADDSESA